MKLVLLGTTGYHPNDLRQTACLMIPEYGIILDAGTGLYRVRDWMDTTELDIYLTHAHLDHVIGLTFLFDVVYERTINRITVHGEPEKLVAVREHLLNELLFPVPLPCEYRALESRIALPGDGIMTTFSLEHPGGSMGFRLDWPGGHSMAYVTDTIARVDADYVNHIRGVDLLVHECYFSDNEREMAQLTGHSHTTPVAQVARAAQVRRLALVHVNPFGSQHDPIGLKIAQAIFPETQIAVDNQVIDF